MKYKKFHGPKIPCKSCRYNARRIKIADCFKCDDYVSGIINSSLLAVYYTNTKTIRKIAISDIIIVI